MNDAERNDLRRDCPFTWVMQLHVPAFALDRGAHVVAWNEALAQLTGVTSASMLGASAVWPAFSVEPQLSLAELLLVERRVAAADATVAEHFAEVGVFRLPVDGREVVLALDACVLRDADGSELGVLQTLVDHSEAHRAGARFRRIFESSPDPVWIIENNTFVDCNDAAVAMLGYASREALLNTHPSQLSPSHQPCGMGSFEKAELMMDLATRNGLHRFEWVHLRVDGSPFDAEVTLARLEVGGQHAIYCTWRDITERKAAERAVRLYATVFHTSGEGILICDADNRIVAINEAMTRLTGYSAEELVGHNPSVLAAGRTAPEVYVGMWQALERDHFWQGELWDRRKDGSVFANWASISVSTDTDGRVLNYIGTFSDISERKEAEARIDWLAHHDALTGLLNRHGLDQRLQQAIAAARREMQVLALVFLDLDRFKLVNDSIGHHSGDQVLTEVGRRLRDCVRNADIIARLGGDEFVLVLTGLDDPLDTLQVTRKLQAALSAPYQVGGRSLHLTPSMGVSLFPTDAQEADGLLREADTAMYHAKESGRNNTQFYATEMTARATARLDLERDLRRALDEDEFELYYQPQVLAHGGQLCGMEALVRWRHPQRGLVGPSGFIAVAEESGLILPLGAWVLDEACRQMSIWRDRGVAPPRMAVNLSVHQLRQVDLVELVRATLFRHHLEAGVLVLEITESAAMERPEQAISRLRELRDMGIELAMDDFGTGYSSLAYLQSLPLQSLKLDRGFVRDLERNPGDAAICAATVALAHKLGLAVVAEGVETAGQAAFLLAQGCDQLQGNRYGEAAPAAFWEQHWRAHSDAEVAGGR
ncbi:MAG: EAL domain-containing protein [Xanthomonadales bacterium]|nr:EAL domain-containing protein [Xanthomonadales bacterium]